MGLLFFMGLLVKLDFAKNRISLLLEMTKKWDDRSLEKIAWPVFITFQVTQQFYEILDTEFSEKNSLNLNQQIIESSKKLIYHRAYYILGKTKLDKR